MQPEAEGCGPCVFQISSEPQASKIHTCLPLPLGGEGWGEGATVFQLPKCVRIVYSSFIQRLGLCD